MLLVCAIAPKGVHLLNGGIANADACDLPFRQSFPGSGEQALAEMGNYSGAQALIA